jgi:hypothetical protein
MRPSGVLSAPQWSSLGARRFPTGSWIGTGPFAGRLTALGVAPGDRIGFYLRK